MAQVINTNIASLNAQRNLNTSQSSLATSLQRLSSGLRINSAKDDAAGLAISERFSTQIRGINQAVRNANDGISLAQTAEGALGEITNNLQRIRELAVQSRNATNSASDRAALQAEVAQLKSEIQRVAEQTSFNGLKLLDGSFSAQAFQVGADAGQTIDVASIVNAQISQLGTWTPPNTVSGAAPAGTGGTAATAGTAAFAATSLVGVDFTTNTVSFEVTVDGGSAQTVTLDANYADADALATAISGQLTGATAANSSGTITITSGTTGTSSTIAVANFDADADGNSTNSSVTVLPTVTPTAGQALVSGTYSALTADAFTINGENIEVGAAATATDRLNDLVTAINAKKADTGVTATIVSGALSLSASDGREIVIGGTGAVLEQTGLTPATTAAQTLTTGFAALDISTTDGADAAMRAMDGALTAVNSARADLGAIQNRFSSVITNLTTSSENLSASRSRILDADFASETANLTRAQILQQAGVAMLAQANALPQNVLSLLRG